MSELPPNYSEGEGLADILDAAAQRVESYQGVNVPPLLRRAATEIRRLAAVAVLPVELDGYEITYATQYANGTIQLTCKPAAAVVGEDTE